MAQAKAAGRAIGKADSYIAAAAIARGLEHVHADWK
jgi:predicted nucleic acid-binding protein